MLQNGEGFIPELALLSCNDDDDVTEPVDAVFYYIDPEKKMMKMVYPITHDIHSLLTFASTPNEIMMADEYTDKIYNFYFPRSNLRLMDSPACCISDVMDILGRGTLTHIGWWKIMPKIPLNKACLKFWQGGGFISDEPQMPPCQMPPWSHSPEVEWISPDGADETDRSESSAESANKTDRTESESWVIAGTDTDWNADSDGVAFA